MNNRNDILLLDTYSSDAQAHIVAGRLEAEGIPCILDNQLFGSSVYPIGFNSIGGIRLMVRASDMERAREILSNEGESDL